jgi:periplasmic protein TonB
MAYSPHKRGPLGVFKQIQIMVLMLVSCLAVAAQDSGGGVPGKVFRTCSEKSSKNCIKPPTPIFSPDPEYSKQSSDAKYPGTCTLMLTVGTDGLPTNIRVIKSLGMGLDEKAIEAVKTWKFDPGMKDGKPVAVELAVDVNFHPHDNNH